MQKTDQARSRREFLAASAALAAVSAQTAGAQSKPQSSAEATELLPSGLKLRARPFPMAQVRLQAGPFRDAQEADRRLLHELPADRLLHNFRVNAGLPSSAQPLGGWERTASEVRGHFSAHFVSACALMHASTGDTVLKGKAEYMVAELAKCQKALG
ncbi:MAG: beta-L-arabinofuranosidase domain-containing protein, partial [Bryobacteraceae bacterium]